MAKIPINYETTSYFANADKEFFINLQQRRLTVTLHTVETVTSAS